MNHTFRSSEREKLEIIAGLLQQADYRISRIREDGNQYVVTARLVGRATIKGERERIEGIVQHFDVEEWTLHE
ncbi:hypothetical protein ACFQO8_06375 [Exiguobacterium aestuarii]|uniref:BON domain-containing protein n=1 Tax=Exiguobacterium aestuarii TaxID=273527 RepID=A0ABW2PNX6_9BACL|nr:MULTISPECIES: hypothetical protein [Exiguobacterium]MCT4786224.1 hypothetical protein [Exiguobacterium aestuarii]